MFSRMFGTVTSKTHIGELFLSVDSGEAPEVGDKVQVLSGVLAARGCAATDDHNALVDAREAICAAVRAQVQQTGTYERQKSMIYVLQLIDQLLRDS